VIGSSLNQYRITASIGAGGMGEVFRARDTRSTATWRSKCLPVDFASDADRLWRFEPMTVRHRKVFVFAAPLARIRSEK